MPEMDPPQILALMSQIQQKLPVKRTVDAAAAAVTEEFEAIAGPRPPQFFEDLALAKARITAQLAPIELVHKLSIVDPEMQRWYSGPKPADRHWPALRGYLQATKHWSQAAVESIDRSSSEVVSLLADPHRTNFSHKGLVVGYVQSGKTANMTAVIAKAIDAGYNFVIVLAGLTNKLRAQTQRRIDADIRERFSHLWVGYTSARIEYDEIDTDANGDFEIPPDRGFQMPAPGRVQYAIVKKESTRLDKLITTFKKTPRTTLDQLKVLLIDDECDQASVNASSSDDGITRINEQLRTLIGRLPACSYIGYTATPFANVFINPFPAGDNVPDDLYPRHFITSLPRPDGYVGTLEVFGSIADGAEDIDGGNDGRPMIRVVPNEEVSKLRPSRQKEMQGFIPLITPSLEYALLWFIDSCAIRRHRGQSASHMTMLVHTSPYVIQHERTAEMLRHWKRSHEQNLRGASGEIWKRFAEVFEQEIRQVRLTGQDEGVLTPEGLSPFIKEVLDALELVIENGISEERLDFTGVPRTYIVVGGSVLARGLTLEGLCVSYFLRTSKQYDTLLQMGRWFGFRQGYEDLPRLWATGDLIDAFRAIGRVEEEIRSDISRYVGSPSFTPLDFAVRVRQIPGLAITSAAKMRHAYQVAISYAGRHVQTICFEHRNLEVITANWKAVKSLASVCCGIGREQQARSGVKLFEHVPASAVLSFLKAYQITAGLDLTSKSLIGYIAGARDALSSWNVAFVGPAKPGERITLPGVGEIGLNRRSKLAASSSDRADIKALMSKADIVIDVPRQISGVSKLAWDDLKKKRAAVPLLLVYPIEKYSEPVPPRDTRAPLDAADHLPAIAMVFPGTQETAGKYFAVPLEVEVPELVADKGEDEEAEAES